MANVVLVHPDGSKALYVGGKRVATIDRTQFDGDFRVAVNQRFGGAETYEERRIDGEFPEELEAGATEEKSATTEESEAAEKEAGKGQESAAKTSRSSRSQTKASK